MGAADVEVPSRSCNPRGLLKSTLEVRAGEAPQGLTAPPLKDDKDRRERDDRLSPPRAPHKNPPFNVLFCPLTQK